MAMTLGASHSKKGEGGDGNKACVKLNAIFKVPTKLRTAFVNLEE